MLDHALTHLLAVRPAAVPLLRRFRGVHVQESTTLSLPAALAPFQPGSDGSASAAAVKLQVRRELTAPRSMNGFLEAVRALTPGRAWPAGQR